MITRSVTIEDIDDLYLMWNDHINASALYRRALREEMEVRGVDSDELRDLLDRAREQGYTKDELATPTEKGLTETNRDLNDLLKQTASIEDLNALPEANPSRD